MSAELKFKFSVGKWILIHIVDSTADFSKQLKSQKEKKDIRINLLHFSSKALTRQQVSLRIEYYYYSWTDSDRCFPARSGLCINIGNIQ